MKNALVALEGVGQFHFDGVVVWYIVSDSIIVGSIGGNIKHVPRRLLCFRKSLASLCSNLLVKAVLGRVLVDIVVGTKVESEPSFMVCGQLNQHVNVLTRFV